MTRSRWLKGLSGWAALLLVGLLWIMFAPVQFGGKAAYAIVTGNSMLPTFRQGDLVILRVSPTYTVGDIAAYRDPKVGAVIHRIIGQEGDRFIFKGDHNRFVDPHRPTQAELIGKQWIHLPSVGHYVKPLRTPLNMTILVAAIGVIGMTAVTDTQHSSRDRQRKNRTRRPPSQVSGNMIDLFFVLGVVAIASLVLGLFAFTRPSSQTVFHETRYDQVGVFSYSASAPPGVYDSETVQTGEPVFRNLTDLVTVSFDYRLASSQPGPVAGAYQLVARLEDAAGWKRTIELQPVTTFSGSSFSASGTLNLSDVQALIDSFEGQAGLRRGQYTLSVEPQVSINGNLAGQPFQNTFNPRLIFRLGDLEMSLVGASEALQPSQEGFITYSTVEPNVLSILGLKLQIPIARQIALVGLAVSLSGIQVLGLVIFQGARGDEAARIQTKYGPLLVSVRSDHPVQTDGHVVELGSIDDLARIAERNNGVILHHTNGGGHRYFVQDTDIAYSYQTSHNAATRT